jgi:hypothetical protein
MESTSLSFLDCPEVHLNLHYSYLAKSIRKNINPQCYLYLNYLLAVNFHSKYLGSPENVSGTRKLINFPKNINLYMHMHINNT